MYRKHFRIMVSCLPGKVNSSGESVFCCVPHISVMSGGKLGETTIIVFSIFPIPSSCPAEAFLMSDMTRFFSCKIIKFLFVSTEKKYLQFYYLVLLQWYSSVGTLSRVPA